MLVAAVEGVLGMGGTPVVVWEGIWLRCLAGMAGLVEGMRGVLDIGRCGYCQLYSRRQRCDAKTGVSCSGTCSVESSLNFRSSSRRNWHHQELSCIEVFKSQNYSIQWYVLHLSRCPSSQHYLPFHVFIAPANHPIYVG